MGGAFEINGLSGEPEGWRSFVSNEIRGFRAPYLSTGPGLFAALERSDFLYDSSTVSREPQRPATGSELLRFALPMIPEGPERRPVLAMDYNMFVRHSGGFERTDKAGLFEERAYQALLDALEAEYRSKRAPLQVGLHFTLMNGGAYWNALERFARKICVLDDVECLSYAEAARSLID